MKQLPKPAVLSLASPLRASFALIACASLATAQTTWFVDVNGTAPGVGTFANPYTSIQYAADRPSTVNGDTLLVAPGTYVENIHVNTKFLTIASSAGPEATILRPSHAGHVVRLYGYATSPVLVGFTITGVIPNVTGASASAVFLDAGAMRGCIVRDNLAPGAMGVIAFEIATVSECTITNNRLGILVDPFIGRLEMRNSIVSANVADVASGGNGVIELDYSAGFAGMDPSAFGVGNIAGDAGMWDPASGEFRLRPGSPCIDAGDPASPLDPDGTRRDIGALAYDASYAPAPLVYCTAKTNSQGCVPAIGVSGGASASSASPCFVTCSNELNQRNGFVFYGFAPKGVAYQGGWLCVQSPTRRTALQNSAGNAGPDDCSGAYSFELNALIQGGTDPALVAGEFVYCQYWSRDPNASFATNRSDAVRVAIGP